MMGEFDAFRELSDKQLEKVRGMAEKNPSLKKTVELYEQVSGRGLSESARKAQEENDRRWDIMVADLENNQTRRTMGAFSDMLPRYGFRLPTPVPPEERTTEGLFADFMNAYGAQGLDLVEMMEVKPETEATTTPKCEECRQEAGMRCKQCGQHYCSQACQKKAWPSHRKVCKLVAARAF